MKAYELGEDTRKGVARAVELYLKFNRRDAFRVRDICMAEGIDEPLVAEAFKQVFPYEPGDPFGFSMLDDPTPVAQLLTRKTLQRRP